MIRLNGSIGDALAGSALIVATSKKGGDLSTVALQLPDYPITQLPDSLFVAFRYIRGRHFARARRLARRRLSRGSDSLASASRR